LASACEAEFDLTKKKFEIGFDDGVECKGFSKVL
jgi:hypothetical protein